MSGAGCFSELPVGVNWWSARFLVEGGGAAALDRIAATGLEGYQLGSVREISATLDPGELREVREHAAGSSFYLEGGLPCIDASRPDPELLASGDGDLRRGLEAHLRALAAVLEGSDAIRTSMGLPGDRAAAGAGWGARWGEMAAATRRLLRDVLPLLEELDLRIAIENHGDGRTAELVELVAGVDPERCGICLDTANLALSLEDPEEATARVAGHVFATHLKDGVLVDDGAGGLTLHARACGEGVFPLAELIEALRDGGASPRTLTVEDHDGLFPIACGDPEFVRGLAPSAAESAAIEELRSRSQRLIGTGELPSVEALEADPWQLQGPQRMARAAEFVRAATGRDEALRRGTDRPGGGTR
ncbi:MAG: sugar phosphate isomerase/epimerase family protein [Solirubrobacterales bacterium]